MRRHRPSASMLVALLALFVALGGSSYAALRIGSAEIRDNSVRSKDLRNNGVRSKDLRNNDVRGGDIRTGSVRATDLRDGDLTGADLMNDTISGADVNESSLATVPRASDALTLGGRSADAFLASDRQSRTGLIKLAHGETRTIASSGPFTWTAQCIDDGGGSTRLTVTVSSTEADSFAGDFGIGGQPVAPGAPATLFDQPSATPVYTIAFPLSAIAPSGAAPTGITFAGLQVLGADCVVNGILWP
jgi:hypothetical protein